MRKKSWKLIGLVAIAAITLAGCLAPGYHLVTPTLRNGTAMAGLWHTFGGNNCYWARLDGNGTVLGRRELDVGAPLRPDQVRRHLVPDGELSSRGSQADGPFDRRMGVTGSTFGNGDFRVGQDIGSGTYTASQPVGCYWARLSGFSGAAVGRHPEQRRIRPSLDRARRRSGSPRPVAARGRSRRRS